MTTASAPTAAGSGTASGVPILTDILRTQRRSLASWAMVLVAIVAIYTSFYPFYADTGGIETQLEALPPALVEALGYDQAGTAGGYVQSTVTELLGMILLLVFAIGRGARTLAGHEEDGTLELELASAVSRTRVYVERSASVLLSALLLVIVVVLAIAVLAAALPLDIPVADLLAAGVSLYLLVAATAAIALAVGAITGRRPMALGAAAGISVLGYVGNAVGPLVEGLGWLGDITPMGWHLGADALVAGVDPVRLAALAITAVVALGAGLAVFVRRDLGTG